MKSNNNFTVSEISSLVKDMVFGSNREEKHQQIYYLARNNGVFPASIQDLYMSIGKGKYHGFTVPAINIRGITYEVARAVFRAAARTQTSFFIFEIARSEIEYTRQTPGEYSACILAAALAEKYQGPVFIQGDHVQIRRRRFFNDEESELNQVKDLIKEQIDAGFYNIDIDASTLVDVDKPTLEEQQELNGKITAELTSFIRSLGPGSITISVGGEIGEIGKGNSTPEDLRAFMKIYSRYLPPDMQGISKISVQTGTSHGGIVLPDGSIAKINVDFKILTELSNLARKEYGMGGAVQHGASTLPDNLFHLFPEAGALEIHLATGFQNIIFDSPAFPSDLKKKILGELAIKYSSERKPGDTDAQFFYRTRKRAFGDFKLELWSLPEENLRAIISELEERFILLFNELKVAGTDWIIKELYRSQ